MLVFSRNDSYLNVKLWDSEARTKLNAFETGLASIDKMVIAAAGGQTFASNRQNGPDSLFSGVLILAPTTLRTIPINGGKIPPPNRSKPIDRSIRTTAPGVAAKEPLPRA